MPIDPSLRRTSQTNSNAYAQSTQTTHYRPSARKQPEQTYHYTINTTSGKRYTLDQNRANWIINRWKRDGADSYGYDDDDQMAKRNGQMSAAMRGTYKNSQVDRDLFSMGLPSEKYLERYMEDYDRWHTGDMDQVFGQMNLPKNYWTNVKGWYQSDMQNAYENTPEDQQRKARGLMPSKWEAKYADTEIDDHLRARGLPPISEFNTYRDRWNNYTGIENFYANVAYNETNLRLAGITDDSTEQSYGGKKQTGHDFYVDAFYDELEKKNDDGSYVYAPIRAMFKNGSKPSSATSTGDYAYDRGTDILAANKDDASDEDYASYNAFSYDDYKKHYDDLYNRYFANQKTNSGQLVSDAMAVKQMEADDAATKAYYTVGKTTEDAKAFATKYLTDHPTTTVEEMLTDMAKHNVPDTEAHNVYWFLKDLAAQSGLNDTFNDVVNAWIHTYGGEWSIVSNSDAPIPDVAKPLTDEQRDAQAEKDRVNAAQQYSRAMMNGDSDALAIASDRAKNLGYNSIEDMTAALKEAKSDEYVQAVKDAIAVYESAMAAYEDTYPGYGAPSAASREPIDKATAALNALGFKSVHDATRYVGGAREADPQKFVRENTAAMNDYVDNAPAPSEEAVTIARNAIEAALIDDNGPMYSSVDAVIRVLDGIAENSANAAAYWQALEDLGFTDLSGMADDLTADWSDADKRKLKYHLGGNNFLEMTDGEDSANNDWSAVGSAQYSQQLNSDKFSRSLEWVLQQVNAGKMTEADGYQLLAANGFQNEMEEYMGDEWHKAHFIENTAPGLYAQAEETDRLLWEEMTPEEQRAAAEDLWNDLSDEQKASMYGKDWWKFDPTVYRTFGQALEQQFQAVLPGLGAEIISTPVKVLDAIEANLSGRPDMWKTTQDLMAFQQKMGNLGAVADNVNGAGVAQTAADVVQEIGRMYFYGSIGGAIGAGFAGTSAGAAVMAGSASNSMAVRGASKMFMSMVKSSPFVVSAFANNYAEAKELGAPNNEATWFALITGLSEGILEGFEFDELWGKVLGQGNFAKQLALGKSTYLERLGIVGKAWISSMAVSGLGEFTEESIGYVLETFLKMRHSDTWGKGTEWSKEDWIEQAMMGFITGALGGGIHTLGSINKQTLIRDYAMSDKSVMRQVFPDVYTATEIAESLPESVLDTYREGGPKVMSLSAYRQFGLTLESCLDNAKKQVTSFNDEKAKVDTKLANRLRELDGYASKATSIDTSKGSGAKELANLVSSKLGIELDMSKPLMPQVKAAFKAEVERATNDHDKAVADLRTTTENALRNSESELKNLQKQLQEHYVGIYLMSEQGIMLKNPDWVLSNMAQAYMNGATVTKESLAQATEQQAAKPSKLAEAEANDTMAEAEQTAQTPEDAATKARELAYNRVYKDQEAGKAYAEGRRGENDSKMTRVEFAENERQNFEAKTTARLRRVTLELAGLEARDGMSAKEIFVEAKKAMTPEAAQKLDMYQKLSKALGLNMVVRDVVAGTSGYVHDGKLYVTLNGKQSMLRVASHELTHYMKGHASEQYDALRTHLVNEVGQEKFDELLQSKAQEYGLDLNDAKARLEADDEVCAELCERMLENQEALEKFVQTDLDAAKTLKQRLGKTLVAIKSAIKTLGTSNTETKNDLIKEQETIEQWYKGLSDAIDNANAEAKGKTQAATETATVTDTTTEAPQAPPVETNPDLFIGDEDARREQLRSDLEELAKRGTKVNGLSYQEVNDVLDRVIMGDKSNYSKADLAQIRGMLAQLIPEVQAYVNGDASVDANVLNERLSAALDYMLDKYSEGSEDYYGLRELVPSKIALSETAYKALRAKDMTLRQASTELMRALGGKFVNFVYKKSPSYNNAMTIDELWGRITDAYGEPDGYGNIQEDALALIDYAKDRSTRTSFDDLYGSQREDVVNAQVGEFLDAVQSMVEGKANETRYIVDRENDLHTRFTDDTINKAKELASRGASEEDVFNETGIYLMPNGDLLDGDTGTTLWRASANGNTQRPDNVLDASSEEAGIRAVQEYDLAGNEREGELVPEPGRARRSWESLSEEQKTEVTNTINSHLANSTDEESNMFFQGWPEEKYVRYIYDAYRDGDAVLEWVCKFVPNIDALISDLDAALGDTRYLLDEDYVPGELDEDAIDEAFIEDVDEAFLEEEINRLLGMRPVAEEAAPVVYDKSVDAQGNKLSDEQVGYFQDSKVRSRDGQLRPVYHYTNGTFTEFAPMHASEHSNRTLGDGYYVSVSPTEYKAFGKNRMVMYANITNPFEMELTPEQAAYVYDKYAAPFHEDKFGLYREHATNALQSWGKSMDYLKQYASENGIGTSDILKDLGFDGIHDGPDWVAFDSNQLKFTDNKTPTTHNDLRFTVDNDLNDLVQQYGAMEQGREPRARDVQVPRRSADNMRVSKFTRSLDESSKVNNAQSAEIESEIGSEADRVKQLWSYIPKSNDETMRKAKEFIAARQPATAQREFHDMVVAGKYGTRTAAIGLQLLADASARDDWASVKEIAYDLRVLATEAGQSAQIFNVLKDLGGVGSAWYVEKLVNNLNTMYADEIQSGQMDPITVSEAAMNQVRAAKTQVEVDAAERLVADEIGPQLPLKLDEKLSNWRYLSMLGNPVTHIRNVTGNNLMHLMGGMKDVVASGVQRILEKTGVTDESDRAHARLTSADKSYWDDFAQKSYDEQKRNLQGGGKLGFQSLVQQSKRSFDNKVLDAIARGKDPGTMSERKGLVGLLQNIRNNGAMGMLEVEDAWGLEKNYKRSLMEYMKAQGYSLNGEGKVGKVGKDGSFTEITNEHMNKAIEWATNQAWTNTFRGPSQLATELNKISKMNTASKLIVEGVMPFKKTPINIAKQGAMYSPAGIVIGTTELLTKVKHGKMSAATAIDHLSSGLTGTALMALGVVLSKAGILRGGGEDKKKLETYLEDTGDQTYAFKFGNVSINMSAIAPATIPLFMGVALQEMLSRNGEDEGVDLSTITDVLAGTLNPFMEMSFMSSLNSALKNYNNEGIGGALGSTILTAAQNYGSQYLPTLGGKVAQFIDPTQRTTKSSATSPVGGNMDYYWRSLVKKVPGAEATLQPDVNIWGQTTTKDSFGDWALDFANKFILPTNVKIANRDAVDNELIRVVESTGNADFLPSDGAKYFKVNGETYKMNASQYTEYSKERGQAAYAALKSTMASASYKNASDEQKADMLKKALDNAYKAVNNTWKEKLGAFDK